MSSLLKERYSLTKLKKIRREKREVVLVVQRVWVPGLKLQEQKREKRRGQLFPKISLRC